MSQIRPVLGALMIVAVILAVIVNFVPFQNINVAGGNIFGFSWGETNIDATPWEAKFSMEGNGDSNTESESWFHEDFDDEEGIDLIRAAGPLLAATMLFSLVSGLAFFMNNRSAALALGGVGTVTAILHTTLLSIGLNDFFDHEADGAVGFFMAIAFTAVIGVTTILGAVARD